MITFYFLQEDFDFIDVGYSTSYNYSGPAQRFGIATDSTGGQHQRNRREVNQKVANSNSHYSGQWQF